MMFTRTIDFINTVALSSIVEFYISILSIYIFLMEELIPFYNRS